MAHKKDLKPGQPAPASGLYQRIGPRGGRGPEVTAEKGKTLPPTQAPGSTYKLKRPAHNKSGK